MTKAIITIIYTNKYEDIAHAMSKKLVKENEIAPADEVLDGRGSFSRATHFNRNTELSYE